MEDVLRTIPVHRQVGVQCEWLRHPHHVWREVVQLGETTRSMSTHPRTQLDQRGAPTSARGVLGQQHARRFKRRPYL
eukprot:6675486-Prymnesium_polylepis.2